MTGDEVIAYIQREYDDEQRNIELFGEHGYVEALSYQRRDWLGDLLVDLRRMMKARQDHREEKLRGPKNNSVRTG